MTDHVYPKRLLPREQCEDLYVFDSAKRKYAGEVDRTLESSVYPLLQPFLDGIEQELGNKHAKIGTHATDQVYDDDYDPRNATYVSDISPEEANSKHAILLKEQITRLETTVSRMTEGSVANGLELDGVLLHYHRVLWELRRELALAERRSHCVAGEDVEDNGEEIPNEKCEQDPLLPSTTIELALSRCRCLHAEPSSIPLQRFRAFSVELSELSRQLSEPSRHSFAEEECDCRAWDEQASVDTGSTRASSDTHFSNTSLIEVHEICVDEYSRKDSGTSVCSLPSVPALQAHQLQTARFKFATLREFINGSITGV